MELVDYKVIINKVYKVVKLIRKPFLIIEIYLQNNIKDQFRGELFKIGL
jgi:hypothetical protein